MTQLLAERSIMPDYAQVVVSDAGTPNVPEPETGEEQVVVGDHAVLVATRPDYEGDVLVQVLRGDAPGAGVKVFDGELSITSGRLTVGSLLESEPLEVDAGKVGYVPVRIFVDPPPPELPSHVTVILSPEAP